MFYRTFGPIYILKSSVLLHFCRSGPAVFGKSASLNVRTTYHIYYFTFKLYFFVKASIIEKIYLIQTNFGFIVCYGIDNVHIEIISIQKLINIDCRITGRNFGINRKEVIDRFIWGIELCHIWIFFKHFLTVLYS